MEKDFDKWNEVKKQLDSAELDTRPFPKEQWVWICSIGINIGFEQNGTSNEFERPALVVKKFNNQMYWVVPLSSRQKSFDFYYNFTDPLGKLVALISSQLKLVSIKRFKREMYRLSDADFENLLSQLIGFLKKSKPRTGRGFSGPSEPEGTLYKTEYTNLSEKSIGPVDSRTIHRAALCMARLVSVHRAALCIKKGLAALNVVALVVPSLAAFAAFPQTAHAAITTP